MTRFQRGYWLTWDSPPAAYAAGAFSLTFLQDIITTLSEVGVQVVVVSDACRAGKLAGSEYGGAQATAAALSKQFANEIKILSCQPEEFSLEGEQWGGGRGCFSYHLVDALYGMADSNGDGVVNLMEVGRYLEEKVPAETAPHQQVPLTVGNRMAPLTQVDADALALWRQQKGSNQLAFNKIESRAQEYLMLANADLSIQELYTAFTEAIEQGRLMPTDSTTGKSANDYYERLIKEPSIASLHGVMTRNFSAALIDEGQQILNRYLRGDRKAEDILYSGKGVIHRQWADQFYRAAELLGENHYFYPKLKAKALYFESFAVHDLPISRDSANVLDMRLLRQALTFDSISPYVWLDLIRYSPEDSLDFYAEKLTELAPNWLIWYSDFAWKYNESKPEKAILFHQKAIELDSTNLLSLNGMAWVLERLGQHEESVRYFETAVRIGLREMEKNTTSLSYLELTMLATSLRVLQRYTEAEEFAKKVIAMDSTRLNGWWELSWTNHAQQRYGEAELVNKKYIELFPNKADGWIELGITYHLNKRFEEAETAYKKAIELDSTGVYSRRRLGNLYNDMKRFDDAIIVLKKAISVDSLNSYIWGQLGWAYYLSQQYPEAERIQKKAVSMDSTNAEGFNDLALVYFKTNRLEEARKGFHKAIALYPNFAGAMLGIAYTFAIEGKKEEAFAYVEQAIEKKANYEELQKDEYLTPLRVLPEWEVLMKKYFPNQDKD